MTNVPEFFGSMVFNESVMKDKLPKETFKAVMETIESGAPLDTTRSPRPIPAVSS